MALEKKQFSKQIFLYLVIIFLGVVLGLVTYFLGLSLLKGKISSENQQEAMRQIKEEKLKEMEEKRIQLSEISGKIVKIENDKITIESSVFGEDSKNISFLLAGDTKIYKYQNENIGEAGTLKEQAEQETILKPVDLKVGDNISFEPESLVSLYQLRGETIKASRVLINGEIKSEMR